jgi:hypothetical protein
MFPYPRIYHLVVLPSKAFYRARSLNLIFTGNCEKCTLLAIVPWSHSAALGTNGRINKAWDIFAPVYEDAS